MNSAGASTTEPPQQQGRLNSTGKERETVPHDERPGAAGVDPEQLWLRPAEPRRGRKPSFSREGIVAAAVAMADAEGIEAVTMRRVAAQVRPASCRSTATPPTRRPCWS